MGGKSFCEALALPRNEAGEPAEHVRLAIGSSDGTVRILNGFNADSIHAAFTTKSGSAISAMAVVPIHNRDAVFAGAAPPSAAATGLRHLCRGRACLTLRWPAGCSLSVHVLVGCSTCSRIGCLSQVPCDPSDRSPLLPEHLACMGILSRCAAR